jgi:hypothetical protein
MDRYGMFQNWPYTNGSGFAPAAACKSNATAASAKPWINDG